MGGSNTSREGGTHYSESRCRIGRLDAGRVRRCSSGVPECSAVHLGEYNGTIIAYARHMHLEILVGSGGSRNIRGDRRTERNRRRRRRTYETYNTFTSETWFFSQREREGEREREFFLSLSVGARLMLSPSFA